MTLTEEQKKTYIEGGGVRCPFCGSSDIEGKSVEIDAGQATQEIGCQTCDHEWTDRYVLADVIPAERAAQRLLALGVTPCEHDVPKPTQQGDESMLPQCPKCDQPARGTLETLSGVALIAETSEGKPIYTGETEVCWDEQKTVVNGHGHTFFVCSCGHTWPDPTVKEVG